jgi:hypothetical protein
MYEPKSSSLSLRQRQTGTAAETLRIFQMITQALGGAPD